MSSITAGFEQIVELDTDGTIIRRWAMKSTETGTEWRVSEEAADADGQISTRCRAIVPGTDVLITQINLPVKRRADLRETAAAYALEDRLAADIETLHFAVADTVGKAPDAEVAVVAKESLRSWQEALIEAGLEVVSMVPDTALVRRPESGVRLHFGAVRCWLVGATGDAIAFDPDLLEQVLSAHEGETLHISREPDVDWRLLSEVTEKARQRGVGATGAVAVEPLLPHSSPGCGCELLSGSYASDSRWGGVIKRLQVPLMLAFIAAAMHISSLSLEVRALTQEADRLDQSVALKFEQLMPGVRMVAPRRQIEGHLESAGPGVAGGLSAEPLFMLNHLGAALANQPGLEVVNLTYGPGQLDAELRAPSLQSLSALTSSLSNENLQADLRQARSRSTGTVGEIRLREQTR